MTKRKFNPTMDDDDDASSENDASLLKWISKIRSSCLGEKSVVPEPIFDEDTLHVLRMVKALIVSNDEII
jgi:hypothetical protein